MSDSSSPPHSPVDPRGWLPELKAILDDGLRQDARKKFGTRIDELISNLGDSGNSKVKGAVSRTQNIKPMEEEPPNEIVTRKGRTTRSSASTNPTTTSTASTAKSTRGRASKRSAAASAAIDHPEARNEEEARWLSELKAIVDDGLRQDARKKFGSKIDDMISNLSDFIVSRGKSPRTQNIKPIEEEPPNATVNRKGRATKSSATTNPATTSTINTTTAKSTRGRSSKRSAAAAVDHSETPDEEIPTASIDTTTYTTSKAKLTRGRASKRSAAASAAAAVDQSETADEDEAPKPKKATRGRSTKRSAAAEVELSETPDEDEAPKPKRATRARSSTTVAEKPTSRPTRSETKAQPKTTTTRTRSSPTPKEKSTTRPTRSSARSTTRGKKKDQEPATELEPETEEELKPVIKDSEKVAEKSKKGDVEHNQPVLEKIEEESDSMVAGEASNREPEILPTVVDVIEGIKDQVERTVEEIRDTDLNDTVPDGATEAVDEKESAPDDASSAAETRDSLDVNIDNNSIREIPDDEVKSIDDKSNDDKSSDDKSGDDKSVDEKTLEEPSTNDLSISDIENDKTTGPGAFKDDQIVPKASLQNGEQEGFKDSGDSKDNNSVDKSINDTENDIGLDETLPMEVLNDKNGEITKRKTDDLEEDEEETEDDRLAIAKQKQIKKPRTRLLDIPDIPRMAGKVMTFGDDMCGELGLKSTGMSKKRPTPVKDVDEPVVYIASGGMHNVCLTSNGQVYTWGCNDEGALGRKTTDFPEDRSPEAEPTKVPFPCKIVKVSAGDSHSAALTSTGSVYIWGNFKDSNGKIGLTCDSKEGQTQPIQIDIPNTVFVDLASGNDHLLLLSDTGEVYSMGIGEQGQLGRISAKEMKEIKGKKELFLKPFLVKFDDDSTICDRVWAGQYSSYTRTKTGEIYAWGLNNYSQLGVPQSSLTKEMKEELTVPFPVRVLSLSKLEGLIEQICPGHHFMLARDSKGKVYSCGRHEYGRLGHGNQDESLDEPKLIESLENETIKHIAAGSITSFAVNEKGDLYAWGMSGAALGLGEEDAWIPTRVEAKVLETHKVISVAAGSQHTAIIVQPANE